MIVHNILWLSRLHESLPGTYRQIHTILACTCEYKEQEKKLQNELKALGVDTQTLWTRFQEIRAASTVCTLKSMLDDCLPIYIANNIVVPQDKHPFITVSLLDDSLIWISLRHRNVLPSWRVIRDYTIATQIPYCEQEISFYRKHQANHSIHFLYEKPELSATLQSIYSLCDIPIPDSVVSDAVVLQRTTHNPTAYRPN